MKKSGLIAFALAVCIIITAVPMPASACLLPSAWAEDELELARQWGLLDARSDSSPGNPGSGSRVSVSRGGSRSGDRNGRGTPGSGLGSPESYTAGITKDEFCQVVVNMSEKMLGKTIRAADVRFSDQDTPGYYYRAYEAGIISGTGVKTDGSVIPGRDEQFSREQIARMLYQAIVYCYPDEKVDMRSAADSLAEFSDRDKISDWAKDSAAYMVQNGIIMGSDGKFLPKDQCTYEQGVILAKRVYENFGAKRDLKTAPVLQSDLSAPVMLSPQGSTPRICVDDGVKLQWRKMSGVERYLVKVDYPGETQTQTLYTDRAAIEIKPLKNKTLNAGQMAVSIAAVDENDNVISPYTRLNITLYSKADYYFDFKNSAEAAKYMKTITVKVWDLDSSGKKVTRTMSLTIHSWVADDVVAIFDEIYNGPEKFPIHDIGGYRAGAGGEHGKGTAVDINANENYEIYNNGRKGVGSFWKPGENPYSIPLKGDVVKAFRAHGWGWGGTDWRTKKDYMHFSYFGT
ncbi:MAG: hypothetical protein HPY50_17380 [Firmicutes bacterium]|nr:hypothetical protein [Bacillota bacterium]